MKSSTKLLKIVSNFLDRCSDTELKELLNGKAKLEIVMPQTKLSQEQTTEDIEGILTSLQAFTTVEEVKDFLMRKSYSKATLRSIAKLSDVILTSKDTNEQIVDKIVERFIGAKLRYDSLLNMDTK